jgi:RNA polymerase sigma factor for flagellar operon FliA
MARTPKVISARDALIEQNIGLVIHIANRVAARLPHERDRDDLVSAGLVGLVEAASRFEPARGMPFSAFAGLRIEGAILDTLRQADRLPRSLRHTQRQIDAAEAMLTGNLGRLPTSKEIADAAGMSLRELHDARTLIAAGTLESIDRVCTDDTHTTAELVADSPISIDDQFGDRESATAVRQAIQLLSERHRFVILGCMFEGRPLRELAATLGVTRSRVSQLKDEAMRQLRFHLSDLPTIDLTSSERERHAQARARAARGGGARNGAARERARVLAAV